MDLDEMDVEGVSLAAGDGRRQQRRVRIDEGEALLEFSLCRSVTHEAATYFALLAGQM